MEQCSNTQNGWSHRYMTWSSITGGRRGRKIFWACFMLFELTASEVWALETRWAGLRVSYTGVKVGAYYYGLFSSLAMHFEEISYHLGHFLICWPNPCVLFRCWLHKLQRSLHWSISKRLFICMVYLFLSFQPYSIHIALLEGCLMVVGYTCGAQHNFSPTNRWSVRWTIHILDDILTAYVVGFGGHWAQFTLLVRFVYNNSYKSNIQMDLYEALFDLR